MGGRSVDRPLEGRTVTNLFFEDSTRTRASFTLAARRLGADVIEFSSVGSSLSKGETPADMARVIESMYRESTSVDPAELDAMRAEYTSVEVDEESGRESERFDELAYTEELRRRLIDAEEITEPELVALARQRATNTNEAVLAADPELDGRVLVVDLREEDTRTSDDSVRMKIALTTGSQ